MENHKFSSLGVKFLVYFAEGRFIYEATNPSKNYIECFTLSEGLTSTLKNLSEKEMEEYISSDYTSKGLLVKNKLFSPN